MSHNATQLQTQAFGTSKILHYKSVEQNKCAVSIPVSGNIKIIIQCLHPGAKIYEKKLKASMQFFKVQGNISFYEDTV